jgi:hypothetical protein
VRPFGYNLDRCRLFCRAWIEEDLPLEVPGMVFRSAFILLACSTLLLISCGGAGSSSPTTYPNATITISPLITSLAVNGAQTFTATVTNGPANPTIQWQIEQNVGSFSSGQTATGTTVTYTAPAASPVYSQTPGSGTTYSSPGSSAGNEGIATIHATLVLAGNGPGAVDNFAITGPVSTGIAPTTATVQLGKVMAFTGYCVGSTNNNLVWQVNGVAGGAVDTGTIAAQVSGGAYYTAPAAMPMTGKTVTVAAACQADPTKSASSTVTLTP